MATGDQTDFVNRLQSVLPDRWFPDNPNDAPILNGLVSGLASMWSSLWLLLDYVSKQRRITTATDINLDIISSDFLGNTLTRRAGEQDGQYRSRIKAALFQEQGTRRAVSNALLALNGAEPVIFEPRNVMDTGGRYVAGSGRYTGLAYGKAGGYGSYRLPFQAFIQTKSPSGVAIAGVQGYGSKVPNTGSGAVIGGYGVGAIEYGSGSQLLTTASDQEAYDTINAVKPIASIMWVTTKETSPQAPASGPAYGAILDINFILDVSRLADSTTPTPIISGGGTSSGNGALDFSDQSNSGLISSV